jgi:hypothetical protein
LFQRKVYDGAIRALTDCRRHLHDRSPELVELRIASGLLGCRYGITDLVAKKNSASDSAGLFTRAQPKVAAMRHLLQRLNMVASRSSMSAI